MRRVLSIQDLSCMGKCSLTVALPVLSAMGCSCTVLPTAVLSTHTAFPEPHIQALTEDILPMAEHWHRVGGNFETISIGYLADPEQAAKVEKVLDLFSGKVVLDPAMGDHGKLYSKLTPEHIHAMAKLCRRADYVLPNITEAALLTGLPYREQVDIAYLRELAAGMQKLGSKTVVITGFLWEDGQAGFFCATENEEFSYHAPRIPKHFHGTGDLFAAVFAGGLALGKEASQAAELAARFVEQVISHTPEATPYGIEFEPQLPWLWQNM